MYNDFTETRQILAYTRAKRLFNLDNFDVNPINGGIEIVDNKNESISILWDENINDLIYIPF